MADAKRVLKGWAAALCAFALLASDQGAMAVSTFVAYDQARFHEGDLMFRAGRGWQAVAVQGGGASEWSHVGILTKGDGQQWRVIHAAVREAALPTATGKVISVSVADFANQHYASAISVWRFKASGKIAAAAARTAWRYANAATPFDDAYDITKDDKLYCTELVLRSFLSAGYALKAPMTHSLLPLLAGYYLLPKSLMATGDFVPVTIRPQP
jgi:hypothetical protein